MDPNIESFLPEAISDEMAYHLINFFTELTAALESRYFVQAKRYLQHQATIDVQTPILEDEYNTGNPF